MKIENLNLLFGKIFKDTSPSGEELPQGFLDLLFLLFNKEGGFSTEDFSPDTKVASLKEENGKTINFVNSLREEETEKKVVLDENNIFPPIIVSTANISDNEERNIIIEGHISQTGEKNTKNFKTEKVTKLIINNNFQYIEKFPEELVKEILAPFYNQNTLKEEDFPNWLKRIFSTPSRSNFDLAHFSEFKQTNDPIHMSKREENLKDDKLNLNFKNTLPSKGGIETTITNKTHEDSNYSLNNHSKRNFEAAALSQEKAKINLAQEKEDTSHPREKEWFEPEPLDHPEETSSLNPRDRLPLKGDQEMAPAPKGPKEEKFEDLSLDLPLEHLERKEPVHHQAKEPTSPPLKVSPAELPEFVKEMVVKTHPEGKHEARLKLHPPELGEIHLSVSVDRGEVKLLLTVEHPRAAEAIQQHLHRLEVSLQELGLQLGGAEINLAGGGAQDQAPERGRVYSSSPSLTKKAEGVEEIRSTITKRNGLIDLRV